MAELFGECHLTFCLFYCSFVNYPLLSNKLASLRSSVLVDGKRQGKVSQFLPDFHLFLLSPKCPVWPLLLQMLDFRFIEHIEYTNVVMIFVIFFRANLKGHSDDNSQQAGLD